MAGSPRLSRVRRQRPAAEVGDRSAPANKPPTFQPEGAASEVAENPDGFQPATATSCRALNPTAALPAEQYRCVNTRSLDSYQQMLGFDPGRLGPGDLVLDCGAGFGLAALTLSQQTGCQAVAINTQDNLSWLERAEAGVGGAVLGAELMSDMTANWLRGLFADALGVPSTSPLRDSMAALLERLDTVRAAGQFVQDVGYAEERVGAYLGRVALLTDYFGALSYSPARAELLAAYFAALRPGGEARLFVDFSTVTRLRTAEGTVDLFDWLAARHPDLVEVRAAPMPRGDRGRVVVLRRTDATQSLSLGLVLEEALQGALLPKVTYRPPAAPRAAT
jgi:SAM-dependent methyltransferase